MLVDVPGNIVRLPDGAVRGFEKMKFEVSREFPMRCRPYAENSID